MAISKVIYGEDTLIDLTADTVIPETLAAGATAHNAAGDPIVGTVTMLTVDEITQLAAQKVDRESLGISNVDNTSDIDKPVSTAQQAALATKAPAGYGLGGSAQKVTDFNTVFGSGWYYGNNAANVPFYYSAVQVIQVNDSRAVQIAYDISHSTSSQHKYGTSAIRRYSEFTWGEWEWVNPPMIFGLEYRTTERRNGSPVYTKLISVGILPSTGTKNINIGIDASRVFRTDVTAYSATGDEFLPLPISNTNGVVADYNIGGTNVYITTNSDAFASFDAAMQIWYI